MKTYNCPICGYGQLDEAPYDRDGIASFSICICCGNEFGYDDANVSHKCLREKWIKNGMNWWSKSTKPPAHWDPKEQISRFDDVKIK